MILKLIKFIGNLLRMIVNKTRKGGNSTQADQTEMYEVFTIVGYN